MLNEPIEKQQLLSEPLSEDALKLGRAIYYTYKENASKYDYDLEVKVESLLKLFRFEYSQIALEKLIGIFEELNEPLGVSNFNYQRQSHPIYFVRFCEYSIDQDMVYITLSEEFLFVHEKYMLDSFL